MNNLLTAVKGTIAFARLAGDMNRLDDVFKMAESMHLKRYAAEGVATFQRTPEGARTLRDKPRLGRLDLAALRALPPGTLGREFAEHMIANKLDPAAIPTLPVDDDGSYIIAHFYETHDIYHVVTGYGTDVPGELGLQAFYLAQGPARLSAMILGAGMLNLILQQGQFDTRDARLRAIVHGWLHGRRARLLAGQRWAELWSVPLAEIRARFGIDPQAIDALLGAADGDAAAPVRADRAVSAAAA